MVTFIHTGLQPGDHDRTTDWKPFKRFPLYFALPDTWLRPGVNERFFVLAKSQSHSTGFAGPLAIIESQISRDSTVREFKS